MSKESALVFAVPMLLIGSVFTSQAQVNSWTKPTSGNWEEMQWSLGVLPEQAHDVMITNGGWKAVQIVWSTAQNQPQSLTVRSITVSSPVDSFNTLLVNYLGFQTPLAIRRSFIVASNSALTILSSAVDLGFTHGEGLSIGGQVNQNDSSQVIGGQLDVGWIGPGVYNLNSGFLDVYDAWVGGPYAGVFNQNGGTNSSRIIHLENGAPYNLRGGDFDATVYSSDGTVFRQDGGRVHSNLQLFRGKYLFNNGVNYGGVTIPVAANFSDDNGNSQALQSGGTNVGPIRLGGWGWGTYVLSNAVVDSPSIDVGRWGHFVQESGIVSSPATLVVQGDYFDRGGIADAYYTLNGGFLTVPEVVIDTAGFAQNGGTNRIRPWILGLHDNLGNLRVGPATRSYAGSMYRLNAGLLTTKNTILDGWEGGFFQSGGTHSITHELSISSSRYAYDWHGYVLSGGELTVPNIFLNPWATFTRTGGTLNQSNTITLHAALINAGPGTQQFGYLQLNASGGDTNSGLRMPTNASVVRFRDSRPLPWPVTATLTISNWNGSYLGGGSHRIIFGNSASALTAQQVRQIFFRDPGGGLSPGLHPTKILPSGEIVPDSVPPTGRIPPRLAVRKVGANAVQVTVTGEPSYNYGILRSYDLANWGFWTNRVATNGTMSAIDSQAYSEGFYKAVLMQ